MKRTVIKPEPQTVAINSVEANGYNPNQMSEFMFDKLRSEIREFGFIDPITIRTGREKGKLFAKPQIIDGEHRWDAAKAEGLTHVLAINVGRLSDARARVLTDVLNKLRGNNDPLKWSEMIESIKADDPTLLEFLPYQSGELDAMLMTESVDLEQLSTDSAPRQGPDGKLYKRFSVSLVEADYDKLADLLRRVKAAHKLDNPTAAFLVVLGAAEAGLVGVQAPAPSKRNGGRRRSQAPAQVGP